jgi:hypothetical protein
MNVFIKDKSTAAVFLDVKAVTLTYSLTFWTKN